MVLKTKKAKHLSLQPEFPCTEQTSARETVPQRDCWERNKAEALRNHTESNLPFSLHWCHVSQGASTPLTDIISSGKTSGTFRLGQVPHLHPQIISTLTKPIISYHSTKHTFSLGLHGALVATCRLPRVAMSRDYSLAALHELLSAVVSLPVAHELLSTGSVAGHTGLAGPTACGIFPDQGSNPCPLHRQADSSPLDQQGSPTWNTWITYVFVITCSITIFLIRWKVSWRGEFGVHFPLSYPLQCLENSKCSNSYSWSHLILTNPSEVGEFTPPFH